MTMTRWTIGVVAAVMMLPAHGALKEADQERLLYMWSESAEVIVEGSIAALTTVDDPEARNAYVEVTVRVNTVQRGEPAGGAIRVRIDDPLQMSMWGEGAAELGARGLWFLHRVQAPSGEIPFGYLIRYISAHEIAGDPIAADKLMRYVIEDSIDQTIAKDILKLLEPTPKGSTRRSSCDFTTTPRARSRTWRCCATPETRSTTSTCSTRRRPCTGPCACRSLWSRSTWR
jgi:hypothetical protein